MGNIVAFKLKSLHKRMEMDFDIKEDKKVVSSMGTGRNSLYNSRVVIFYVNVCAAPLSGSTQRLLHI